MQIGQSQRRAARSKMYAKRLSETTPSLRSFSTSNNTSLIQTALPTKSNAAPSTGIQSQAPPADLMLIIRRTVRREIHRLAVTIQILLHTITLKR